jgi:hypothetical protein
VLGEDVEGAVELVEGQIPRRRQPDPLEPAFMTAQFGARSGEALRGHRQQGGPMRRVSRLGREPVGDRLADAEPGPQLLDHVDHAELKARLDLDRWGLTLCVRRRLATVAVEHPADAAHQPLQRRPVEAVGAAEAVHHPGLDLALLGMADVLGERVVADDRAVLVPALGGPKIHAHAYSVPEPAYLADIPQMPVAEGRV